MKRLFPLLFTAVFLLAGSVRADNEIVFIDQQEVFKRFYKTQLAQDQIRQQLDDIKRERDQMESEVESMKTEIETLRTDARDKTLSEDIRANKRDLLEEKLVALQKKQKDMADFEKLRKQQIDEQNQRMTNKLFDEIHDAVVTYAKKQGYRAVIDRSAQSRMGPDVVLYSDIKSDITARVLAVLNDGRETKPAAEESSAKIDAGEKQ